MDEIVEEQELMPISKKNIDNGEEEFQKKVEIVVRTIGPAPPSRLRVPSPIRVRISCPSLF